MTLDKSRRVILDALRIIVDNKEGAGFVSYELLKDRLASIENGELDESGWLALENYCEVIINKSYAIINQSIDRKNCD
jgi:hypothetical protein